MPQSAERGGCRLERRHAPAAGRRCDPHADDPADADRGVGPPAGPLAVAGRSGRARRRNLRRIAAAASARSRAQLVRPQREFAYAGRVRHRSGNPADTPQSNDCPQHAFAGDGAPQVPDVEGRPAGCGDPRGRGRHGHGRRLYADRPLAGRGLAAGSARRHAGHGRVSVRPGRTPDRPGDAARRRQRRVAGNHHFAARQPGFQIDAQHA